MCVPLLLAVWNPPANADATRQNIVVPAYFDNGDTPSWTTLDGGGTGTIAIVNEDNGPLNTNTGTATVDGQLAANIKAAHAAGLKVIAYVDTGYLGTSPDDRETRTGSTSEAAWVAQTESDINTWYQLYGSDGIDGFFFDDGLSACPSGSDYVTQYAALKQYAEQQASANGYDSPWVVDNPGSDISQCYLTGGAADAYVDFEGDYSDYMSWQPESWELSAGPSKFVNLIYDATSESEMTSVISKSQSDNAGGVYVTDRTLSENPWLQPGSYFSNEVADVDPGASTGAIQSGISGYCLDDTNNANYNSAPVTIDPCNGSPQQQWTVGSDGTIQINGLCLDVQYNQKSNGAPIDLYQCNGQTNQQWTPNSNRELVGTASGICLDDPAFKTNGTPEDIWDCNAGDNQQWTLP